MTSKEALQILVNNTKQLYFNIDIEGLSKTDKEAITTIERDLEILDLLKQHSGIVEMYSNVAKLGEHFVCEINYKKDVEKLKEWLGND